MPLSDDEKTALFARLGHEAGQCLVRLEVGFPHVYRRIVAIWGSAELDRYLQDLMMPARDGRRGFPFDAASDIMRLSLLHGSLGADRATPGGVWAAAPDADIDRGDQS